MHSNRLNILFILFLIFTTNSAIAEDEDLATQIMGHPQMARIQMDGRRITSQKRSDVIQKLRLLLNPHSDYSKRQEQAELLFSNLQFMLDIAEEFKLKNGVSARVVRIDIVILIVKVLDQLKDYEITGFHLKVLNSAIETTYAELNKKLQTSQSNPIPEYEGVIQTSERLSEYNELQASLSNVLQRGLDVQSQSLDADTDEAVATLELSANEEGVFSDEETRSFRQSHALDYFAANYTLPNGEFNYDRGSAERVAMREYLSNRGSRMGFRSLGRVFGRVTAGQLEELVEEIDTIEDIDASLENSPEMVEAMLVSILEMNRLGLVDRIDDVIKAGVGTVNTVADLPIGSYFTSLADLLTNPEKRDKLASLPGLGSEALIQRFSLDPDGDTRLFARVLVAEITESLRLTNDGEPVADRIDQIIGASVSTGFRLAGGTLGLGVKAIGLSATGVKIGVEETGRFLDVKTPVLTESLVSTLGEGASRLGQGARSLWERGRSRMGGERPATNLLPAPLGTCESNF